MGQVKDLYAVVAAVRDKDAPAAVHRHAQRGVELARQFPVRAEYRDQVQGRRENLHPVVRVEGSGFRVWSLGLRVRV